MVRSELIAKLTTDNPGLTSSEVDQIVAAFFDTISSQLVAGGRVEMRGFGTFAAKARVKRTGRNPRTGVPVDVQPKLVPRFKAGKQLALALRNKPPED